MQEIDAERRIQILRGLKPSTPPPPPSAPSAADQQQDRKPSEEVARHRKRRRLAGEDDTDRDIRLAREDAAQALAKRDELLSLSRSGDDDAPIVDSAGHINLFSTEEARRQKVEKNAAAEAEAAKKKREYEDQYTMRFSNAAGFKESVGQRPWYSSSAQEAMAPESMPGKDVWGNEDPMRREREKARMDANDPLAAMKKGVRQLKEVERERKKWLEQRNRELEALKRAEKEERRRRRRRSRSRSRSRSVDSLEGFSLDADPEEREERHRRRHRHRHHHHHHRERSRERSSRHSHSHSHSHRHCHRDDDRDHDRDRDRDHSGHGQKSD